MEDPEVDMLRKLLAKAIEECNDICTLDLVYKILISEGMR